ncbi:MAG: SRP-less Sec system protein [Leptospiraceae bacterium]|nr:SRP-less Sec system protein [Leptospiraceae bacterium]MCZ8346855.1 SRP-less Sec system protein [Leptospiraceae bacterium]
MKLSWIPKALTVLMIGIVMPLASQGSDGLDFLDKVENIKIPVEKEAVQKTAPKSTSTSPTPTTKSTKQSTSTKKSNTSTTKKSTSTTTKKTNPISSSLTSPSTNTNTNTKPPSTTSTSKSSLTPQDSAGDTETSQDTANNESLESAEWIDDSLAMNPDYLPGFVAETSQDEAKEQASKSQESETSKVHPLPQITGNYSIWNSFVEFLSKYQKAFYIFGILILFGLYRLRSGGSSSSRKSSPTIRRMRR